MANHDVPTWASRLREERKRRLWSQKTMAIRLRNAADARTRAGMPSVESVQRYVRWYEAGSHKPGDLHAELYCRVFGLSHQALFDDSPKRSPSSTQVAEQLLTTSDAIAFTAWIEATNTSQDAIDHIAAETARFAEIHTQMPAHQVLAKVVQLHRQTHQLLQAEKQRLNQRRELFRIDADLLAHACLLLGDLSQDQAAAAFGATALLAAQEAEANEAKAWSAQAKTARWQGRYAQSADLARRGFDRSPATQIRVWLASQEANAAGLLGDAQRAREALGRAERAAEHTNGTDTGTSAWSFPRPRQALFALSVATRTGDPEAALRAAAAADTAWKSGEPRTPGTWAQIRVGAGIAHLMKGDLDGTIQEVTPMLTLEPEFRMATVTRYLEDLAKRLKQRRYQRDPTAQQLLQRIDEFNAVALTRSRKGVHE